MNSAIRLENNHKNIHLAVFSATKCWQLFLSGIFFLLAAGAGLNANEPEPAEVFRGLRGRTLVIDIDARVLEQDYEVIWNEVHRRLTLSGNPVSIRLVGSNVIVAIQLTPFIRQGGNVLVAQGQIWAEVPNEGIRYHTSIQTIPIAFDEPVYFFPFGRSHQIDGSLLEIMLTMKSYGGSDVSPAVRPEDEG